MKLRWLGSPLLLCGFYAQSDNGQQPRFVRDDYGTQGLQAIL